MQYQPYQDANTLLALAASIIHATMLKTPQYGYHLNLFFTPEHKPGGAIDRDLITYTLAVYKTATGERIFDSLKRKTRVSILRADIANETHTERCKTIKDMVFCARVYDMNPRFWRAIEKEVSKIIADHEAKVQA